MANPPACTATVTVESRADGDAPPASVIVVARGDRGTAAGQVEHARALRVGLTIEQSDAVPVAGDDRDCEQRGPGRRRAGPCRFACLRQLDRGCEQPKSYSQPYERDRTPRGALATSRLLERS